MKFLRHTDRSAPSRFRSTHPIWMRIWFGLRSTEQLVGSSQWSSEAALWCVQAAWLYRTNRPGAALVSRRPFWPVDKFRRCSLLVWLTIAPVVTTDTGWNLSLGTNQNLGLVSKCKIRFSFKRALDFVLVWGTRMPIWTWMRKATDMVNSTSLSAPHQRQSRR